MEDNMHYTNESNCGHHSQHHFGRAMHHHGDCCCGSGHGHRRFFTKEEIVTHLEEYLQQLQAEAKGVEEHINQIRKADTES